MSCYCRSRPCCRQSWLPSHPRRRPLRHRPRAECPEVSRSYFAQAHSAFDKFGASYPAWLNVPRSLSDLTEKDLPGSLSIPDSGELISSLRDQWMGRCHEGRNRSGSIRPPLQDWQCSCGAALEQMFEQQVPNVRGSIGVGSALESAYDGSRLSRAPRPDRRRLH